MRYYLIPGLGADERVFRNLRFPPRSEITCLGWITPHLGESLRAYALRMSARIDKEEEFTLVGLSLGGMIAVEIANHRPVRRVILISSVPLSAHLPRYFRLIARSRLHQFLPVSILKNASRLKRLFTRETSEDKAMLRVMISDCSNEFIRWA
ncbi:MAG TPA: alpha/beta hydrolase, partial [Flavisolibacter sp.]|nr:alpha/beta hydrolase [Flavisolibacter sp.]